MLNVRDHYRDHYGDHHRDHYRDHLKEYATKDTDALELEYDWGADLDQQMRAAQGLPNLLRGEEKKD